VSAPVPVILTTEGLYCLCLRSAVFVLFGSGVGVLLLCPVEDLQRAIVSFCFALRPRLRYVCAGTVSTGCARWIFECVCSDCDPYYWGSLCRLFIRSCVFILVVMDVCVLMWLSRGTVSARQ
jgi:hypothetical protein